jgi:hypothetical protein
MSSSGPGVVRNCCGVTATDRVAIIGGWAVLGRDVCACGMTMATVKTDEIIAIHNPASMMGMACGGKPVRVFLLCPCNVSTPVCGFVCTDSCVVYS